MKSNYLRITVIKTARPQSENINDALQWFGGSLGLFNLRDKDKSCFRLFIALLKVTKMNRAITSDELADQLSLSRGTVVHHLNKLIEAGIVVHKSNHYTLKSGNLVHLVDEVERDVHEMFQDIREIARQIDERL